MIVRDVTKGPVWVAVGVCACLCMCVCAHTLDCYSGACILNQFCLYVLPLYFHGKSIYISLYYNTQQLIFSLCLHGTECSELHQ